jgi:hypothetical protein
MRGTQMGENSVTRGHVGERRKRMLSDDDIEAIAQALAKHSHDSCRFEGLTRDDVLEAVKFYRNFNDTVSSSKKTVLNAVLVIVITGLISLTSFGVIAKITSKGPGQ